MFCNKCGLKTNGNEKFCVGCGSPINQQVNNNVAYSYNNQMNNANNPKQGKSIASLVLGIISIIFSFPLSIIILPISIVGLILGIVDKNKNGKSVAGIILNSISIVSAITSIFFFGLFIWAFGSGDIFYGDGYEIDYDSNWSSVELKKTDGTTGEGLEYKSSKSYLVPIGTSSLSTSTEYYGCDFDDSSCRDKIYNLFYKVWSSQLLDSVNNLYKDYSTFKSYDGDIYYATFDYGKSSVDINGKYYLIASTEKDVLLSFMTSCSGDNCDEIHNGVVELLDDITINDVLLEHNYDNEYSDNEYIEIDEDDKYISEMLDSLRNWNLYSSLRSGKLGKVVNLTGGWRTLSDSEDYWYFKDGKFWWYKSVNDLNDNYWYGTTEIIKGKDGLTKAGLDSENVNTIITNSNGQVSADDIYTVILTPTKIISGGVDKSSTNIPDGTKWTYIWIVVDHGKEGIEGQVLNMQNNSALYFVKLED